MRVILNLAAAAVMFTSLSTASAETTEFDHNAFKLIITKQIEAFRADDAAAAFSFASPELQRQIGDPGVFVEMVRRAYPALYSPLEVKFGRVSNELGRPTMHIDVKGPHGKAWEALYGFVRQPDGAWRVYGVVMKPQVSAEANLLPGQLVAKLASDAKDAEFVATYSASTKQLSVTQVKGEAPAGKAFEVWLLIDHQPPVSLGLVSGRDGKMPAVPEKFQSALAQGAKLAISLEGEGGSPTGAPTGPIVAKGQLSSS